MQIDNSVLLEAAKRMDSTIVADSICNKEDVKKEKEDFLKALEEVKKVIKNV